MESLWLLPILFLFLFLSIGQVFKIYVAYDIYKNEGLVVFKFFALKIINVSFSFSVNEIKIITNKKIKTISFEPSDPNLKFAQALSVQIKDKLRVKEIDISAKIGLGEAQQTAILSAAAGVFFKVLCAYVKNVKPTASVNAEAFSSFHTKVLQIAFYGKMSLSLFDFLYALLVCAFGQKNT